MITKRVIHCPFLGPMAGALVVFPICRLYYSKKNITNLTRDGILTSRLKSRILRALLQ
jgi:hypothetical protein